MRQGRHAKAGRRTYTRVLLPAFCLLLLALFAGVQLLLNRSAPAPAEPEEAPAPPAQQTLVLLEGDRVTTEDPEVQLLEHELLLAGEGPYLLRGTLRDRGVHVAGKGETVLVFDGLEIQNPEGEALLAEKQCDLTVFLQEGTRSTLESGTERELLPVKEASGAALEAKGNLTVTGNGQLQVLGYLNNAVRCRGQFSLEGGAQLTLRGANRGVRSLRFSLADADCRIQSGGEGVYTEESFALSRGSLTVSAGDHGIKSEGSVSMDGGRMELWSQNGHGIKADGEVRLSGGELLLDALEDGIDSAVRIELACPQLQIRSGGDGLKVSAGGNSASPAICLQEGEILISSYGAPFKADGGCRITRGVSLLAAGIVSPGPFVPVECPQQLTYERAEGSKHELLRLQLQGETALSMEAAYGYNLVMFSLPGAAAKEQMHLVIEK